MKNLILAIVSIVITIIGTIIKKEFRMACV